MFTEVEETGGKHSIYFKDDELAVSIHLVDLPRRVLRLGMQS